MESACGMVRHRAAGQGRRSAYLTLGEKKLVSHRICDEGWGDLDRGISIVG
jgi:hypothetical protein